MSIVCWLVGHKENDDIKDIDMVFTRTKNAIYQKKKLGEVDTNYALAYCDRCKHLYFKKAVIERLREDKMIKDDNICKKCKKENHCPCTGCEEVNKNKLKWVWDREIMHCGGCNEVLPGQ